MLAFFCASLQPTSTFLPAKVYDKSTQPTFPVLQQANTKDFPSRKNQRISNRESCTWHYRDHPYLHRRDSRTDSRNRCAGPDQRKQRPTDWKRDGDHRNRTFCFVRVADPGRCRPSCNSTSPRRGTSRLRYQFHAIHCCCNAQLRVSLQATPPFQRTRQTWKRTKLACPLATLSGTTAAL